MRKLFLVLAICGLALAQQRGAIPAEPIPQPPVRPHPPVVQPSPVPDDSSSSSASSSSSPIVNNRPNIAAIFSSCASDMITVCQNQTPEECLENLRLNWAALSDTCKTTLQNELPCINDAVTHCQHAANGMELINCLFSLESSTVSQSCSAWLQAARQEWAQVEPQPAIDPIMPEGGWDDGSNGNNEDLDDNDYNNGNNGMDDEDDDDHHHHHHGHGGKHHRWGGKRHHGFFFMLIAVAVVAGAVGSCCTLCCMRRRLRCCRNGGAGAAAGGCPRRFNCGGRLSPAAAAAAGGIPLNQMPPNGGMRYAVMADEVHTV